MSSTWFALKNTEEWGVKIAFSDHTRVRLHVHYVCPICACSNKGINLISDNLNVTYLYNVGMIHKQVAPVGIFLKPLSDVLYLLAPGELSVIHIGNSVRKTLMSTYEFLLRPFRMNTGVNYSTANDYNNPKAQHEVYGAAVRTWSQNCAIFKFVQSIEMQNIHVACGKRINFDRSILNFITIYISVHQEAFHTRFFFLFTSTVRGGNFCSKLYLCSLVVLREVIGKYFQTEELKQLHPITFVYFIRFERGIYEWAQWFCYHIRINSGLDKLSYQINLGSIIGQMTNLPHYGEGKWQSYNSQLSAQTLGTY